MLKEHDESCREIEAERIVIFNSKYAAGHDKESAEATDPVYSELSCGEFDIHTEDQALREKFDAIRKCILENRKKQ